MQFIKQISLTNSNSLNLWMNIQNNQFTFLLHPQLFQAAITNCIQQIIKDTHIVKEMKTIFHSKSTVTVSISSYLTRIFKYMNCSPIVFIYALAMIDKIQELHQDFYMTDRNAHRLLITSIVVSAKFFDDFYFKNSFYAKLGGISTQLLNQMEQQFLKLLNFSCFISQMTIKSYLQRIEFYGQLNQKNGI